MSHRYLTFALFLFCSPHLLSQSSWEEIRSIAQSQHEIIMLLIEKGEFSKVPEAAQEIFKLEFPPPQEHRLVEEARLLTDALIHHKQIDIAHQVLKNALESVSENKSKAQLLKEQAYLYKHEGKSDEAMKCFERSVELEKEGDK